MGDDETNLRQDEIRHQRFDALLVAHPIDGLWINVARRRLRMVGSPIHQEAPCATAEVAPCAAQQLESENSCYFQAASVAQN